MEGEQNLDELYGKYRNALIEILQLILVSSETKVRSEDAHRFHLLQGLIRPVVEVSRDSLQLLDEGHIFAANIVARVVFELSVYAQWFYLHPNGSEYLDEKYHHSIRDLMDNSFLELNEKYRDQYESLNIPEPDEELGFVKNFMKILYRQEGRERVGRFVQSDQLMKIYFVLSQYIHPLASFHLYITERPDGAGPVITAKSNDRFALHPLQVILNSLLMVVVIEEDLKIEKPKLEAIYKIAAGVDIWPWLKISDTESRRFLESQE